MYPDCVKNIQEVNEHVCAGLGTYWNTLYPDCLKIIQDVNERICTVPGTHWSIRYPDCVRNIHVVNGCGYTLLGTHWNALRHCFQLVPGIFTLALSALSEWRYITRLLSFPFLWPSLKCGSADVRILKLAKCGCFADFLRMWWAKCGHISKKVKVAGLTLRSIFQQTTWVPE